MAALLWSKYNLEKKKKATDNVNRKGDKEYGVSRGIDFYRVANIINFDFPMDFDAYVHRVGRTARVDQKGKPIKYSIIIFF